MEKTFESSDEFYAVRGGRQSEECDFGCWWRLKDKTVRYRVSVIHETGDVYAARLAVDRQPRIILLGTLRASGAPHCGDCAPGRCPYREAESRLSGWSDLPHDERTLDWITERLL